MIRYLTAEALKDHPRLATSMFRDRARQFRDRQKWDVPVDADGLERDDYDALNPLYAIVVRPDGLHAGSMRFLPTLGPTMVKDHFLHLTQGVAFESAFIWECTRFCIAKNPSPLLSARLMLSGLTLGLRLGLSHAIGVFDARMVRVYSALGWAPATLGTDGAGRDAISAGLWAFEPERAEGLARRAGVSLDAVWLWAERDLGPLVGTPALAA